MPVELSMPARLIEPGSFEPAKHYYQRVLNAQIHPTVAHFLSIGNERLVRRYCHMHPRVHREELSKVLSYQPSYLPWAGADLFYTATAAGTRRMVVIETNSCPSGQKSMPPLREAVEDDGYRSLLERSFLPRLKGRRLPEGGLAVIYDKNPMEASGYAACLADCAREPVYLATFYNEDPDPAARFAEGVLEVRDEQGTWRPIRAAFRYVTQKPWNRIPVHTKTMIFNPTLACLAGGRNKMLAAKAYDLLNAEMVRSGLTINTPETFWDVSHTEIPLWVRRLGGLAVVKIPYSNAGQGVYTITSEAELEAFMERGQHYEQFIVQSLIGNSSWSSETTAGRIYHVGTVPTKSLNNYVADVRMMISTTEEGYRPLALYARRSRAPLADRLDGTTSSWDMLGTNLSIKREDGGWDSDTDRLRLMDRKDFNTLGIGIDELIDGFFQTVLAAVAIDKLACTLMTRKGKFRMKLFSSLNRDAALIEEISV